MLLSYDPSCPSVGRSVIHAPIRVLVIFIVEIIKCERYHVQYFESRALTSEAGSRTLCVAGYLPDVLWAGVGLLLLDQGEGVGLLQGQLDALQPRVRPVRAARRVHAHLGLQWLQAWINNKTKL